MRVAICISGQMRTYKKAHASLIKHVVSPNVADVFVDAWDRAGNTNKLILLLPSGFDLALPIEYWHSQPDVMNDERSLFESDLPNLFGELQRISSADDIVTEAEIKELYAPIATRIEPFIPSYFDGHLQVERLKRLFPDTTGLNAAPMFYKIHGCDLMRRAHEQQQGFTYDVVVRMRPDLEFFSDVIFSAEEVKNRLWTLWNPYYGILGIEDTNSNDMLFVGDSDTMSYTANLWNELPTYWDPDHNPERSFADRGPERILNDHLRARGLQDSVLKLDPAPNRVVAAIQYPRLIDLLKKDMLQMRQLPNWISDCVALAQSRFAIHLLALGDSEGAEHTLREAARIGNLVCAEPHVGRAKLATILNRTDRLSELLSAARETGQVRAFPELFA
ncbi:hypothetical protein [Methylobacterium sp. A52T]